MIVIGIDAHRRSHTVVAVNAATGRQIATLTVKANEEGHQQLLRFADHHDAERQWAVEDCRNLSRHLEAALLRAGQQVVRVPPKLMARQRESARSFGKSDPIDALAVARAALREPDLPTARLAGPEREIALILDHRANLIVERTRLQSRLRWLLYELDPTIDLARRSLDNLRVLKSLDELLAQLPSSTLLRITGELVARIRELTLQARALQRDLRPLVHQHAAVLLALRGVGIINAARLLAEVADVRRFRTEAQLALYAGVAPLDASSGRQQRHRLNRTGNRQLNSALHMIAITQARIHPPARAYIARRREQGKTGKEALRALKRHLIRTLYRLLKNTNLPQLT